MDVIGHYRLTVSQTFQYDFNILGSGKYIYPLMHRAGYEINTFLIADAVTMSLRQI
jgi:hypothetical protein